MPTHRRSSLIPTRATRGLSTRLVAAERALQVHRRIIDALHHIAALALREQPLPAVLQEVAQEVSAATGFPIVAIEFYDPVGRCMEFAAATGIPFPPGEDRLRVPVDQTLSGLVAQRGQVLVEAHAQERPEYIAAELRQLGVQTFVCLPLIVTEQMIGTLSLAHPDAVSLDADLVPLAQSLTNVIATLIARRRAEEHSQAAERHLRALLDKLAAGVVQLDADGCYLFANERAAASFGLTPPELIGKSLDDLFPPDVARHYLERNRRFIADEAFEEREESFDLPSGRRTFFIADQVLPDTQGMGSTLLTSAVDITAHKRAEAESQVALSKYRTLFESFPLGITVSDATGQIVEANQMAERLLGLGAEAQRQRAIDGAEWQIVRPDGSPMPAEEFASVRALREQRLVANVEMGVMTPGGATTWINVTAAPLPLVDGGVVVTYGDISARRQAEAALRESRQNLEALIENTDGSIWSVDPQYRLIVGNRRFHHTFHAAVGRYLQPGDDLLAPELPPVLRDAWRSSYDRALRDGPFSIETTTTFTPTSRTMEYRLSPVTSPTGQALGVTIFGQDITERKANEAALRRSEQTFRALYESMQDAFVVVDMPGFIQQYSRSFQELLGYSDDELVQLTYHDITPERWHAMEARIIQGEVLTQGYSSLYEKEYRRKDGSIVPIELRAVLLRDAQGQPSGLWGIIRDITERRHAEALVATQRDLARLIATTTDPVVAWPRCLALAMQVCELDGGGLYLFDADAQALELVAHQGLSAGFVQAAARYPLDAPNAQLLLAGKAVYWSTADLQQRDVLRLEALTCVAVMPIHAQGRILGCVNLGSHTLPEVPTFARHALETIAPEIGNVVVALRTAAALHESQLRLELAVAGADLGTWDWEVPTGRTVFNERWAEIIGYTLAELAPVSIQTWMDLCHPDDLQSSDQLLQAHFAGETAFYECEARMRHQSGAWIWVVDRGKVVEWGDDGTPLRMAGTHLDITARKQAELALRASEAHYRGLMESLGSMVFTLDATGTLQYVNQLAARQLSGTPHDLVGQRIDALLPAAVVSMHMSTLRRVFTDGTVVVNEDQVPVQGKLRWHRISFHPIHNELGQVLVALVNATDIHDLKTTQEELRALNQTLEARVAQRTAEVQDLYDHAPVGYHSLDRDGKLLHVNQTESDWLGYPREELLGRKLSDLMTPPSQARVPAHFARLLAQGWLRDFEVELIRKDGSTFPALINATAIYDGAGTFVRTRSTLTDLTLRKQAEAALAESERRYRTLVEQMTQGVLVYQDEQVVFGNAAAAQIIGCSVEDLQRASFGELANLLHADDRRRIMLLPEERAATGSATAEPFRFTRMADGSLRWVFATSTITTFHGQPAVLAVFTDVTALKETEERLRLSEARLHLLLDKTPAVIFSSLAEPDFRLTFMSESVRAVLGYEPAQFLSSPGFWASRIHPEDKARVFSDASQLQAQGWRQYEYRCRHADGGLRWVESGVSLLPAVEGRPAEVVGYIIDITARKEAEELLRQANLELARAARLKDEFLANMSHELRTPLNAILGFSEGLQAAVYEPLTARQQGAIQHIETSGRHLLDLINDILDLAKVEAGQLALVREQFEIADVCQASLLFVKELAHKKGIQLSLTLPEPLAPMEADSRRLKQMLINLLANAVKFTPDGGRVSLEVTIDAQAGEVRFAVRDTGIGITLEEQTRLFQPFVQLDSSLSRQHDGTGLGLALVRRLTELQGGRVTLESEVGAGSCFTLILPLAPPTPEPPPLAAPTEPSEGSQPSLALTEQPHEPGLGSAHILLVEDNEPSIQVTSDYLQARGFVVSVVRTGREALATALAQSPNLILMDIQLPELDGLEVMRQLRALPSFARTPIIALTALAMPGDRERCLAAGANAYLTKPIRFRELLEAIRRLLQP